MLNTDAFGYNTKLADAIQATDSRIRVWGGDGARFEVKAGTHYYLTLKYNGNREVVKVVSSAGDELTVVRGQDGTVAISFPALSCIAFEWNPQQLCEYIQQCVSGINRDGVTGTECIECGTCLTLENGRVVKGQGASPC